MMIPCPGAGSMTTVADWPSISPAPVTETGLQRVLADGTVAASRHSTGGMIHSTGICHLSCHVVSSTRSAAIVFNGSAIAASP